jgi:predicted ester cyclase
MNANCEIVRNMLLRQYNDRDLSVVDEVIAENHIDHNPTPGQEAGRAGVKKLLAGVLSSGDFNVEVHEVFGAGDLVASRYTVSATHHGDFMGMSAAGKVTKTRVIGIDRLENGQIVESWGEYNPLEMMQQLGVLPQDLVQH